MSRVVNGATTVDADLAAGVQRAAAQLHYRHNMTASNLRRGDRRSFMIGPMLEDVSDPYSQILFRRIDGDTSAVRQHVVPTRLIARGSGEIPPG